MNYLPLASKLSVDTLLQALDDIQLNGISFCAAEAKYNIPKSTLHDYATGKSLVGCKQGPATVLTAEEEHKLVNWAVEMATVGYGQSKRQSCEMVKKIIDKDGRPNPFKDNRPGKDRWYAFLTRNPAISLRSASSKKRRVHLKSV